MIASISGPILVFGAGGQVGREMAPAWSERRLVVGLDRASCDIIDAGAVDAALARVRPAAVVNCAAYTAVDRAEDDADAAFAINATAPGLIAAACARGGVPLIHLSTDYVFDGTKSGAYVETDPVAPLGVYGASKAAGEDAVRRVGGPHAILRTSWVFGRHGGNFVKTMLRLAAERPALRVVADQHGCPTPAAGIAAAVAAVAEALIAEPAKTGTYHLAGAPATTWAAFARAVIAEGGRHGRPTPPVHDIGTADYPTRARRPANSVLDTGRLAAMFGIQPPSWAPALAAVVAAVAGGENSQ